MKFLITLFVILSPLFLVAQSPRANFFHIDSKVTDIPVNSPDSLARQLTARYKTDLEKVRAIFKWITENIAYNVNPARNIRKRSSSSYLLDDPKDTTALKPLSERVAIDVLERRLAFCDGYARLFKTLCEYAGIKSEVITGYASGGIGRRRFKFSSNHRWNAVYIDSSWHLLDVTWASGYVTFHSDEFVKHFNESYFLTPAKEFIRDHYPEDLRWTLLPDPPNAGEYHHSPYRMNAYITKQITSYAPASGTIEASVGDTLRFELITDYGEKQLVIVDTPYIDSAVIAAAASNIYAKGAMVTDGKKMMYRYIVTSASVKWLTVIFDEEMVLRYRLNIRSRDTAGN
jgi:transglutaminase/protease-like cytokinesis protein 3